MSTTVLATPKRPQINTALPGPKGMLYESLRLQSNNQNGETWVIGTLR